MEGVTLMTKKPAMRITPGDVPGPYSRVNVTLFGGHLDGLPVSRLEVPGAWPVITTLESVANSTDLAELKAGTKRYSFMARRYQVCLCETGKPVMDRRNRVRYCLIED